MAESHVAHSPADCASSSCSAHSPLHCPTPLCSHSMAATTDLVLERRLFGLLTVKGESKRGAERDAERRAHTRLGSQSVPLPMQCVRSLTVLVWPVFIRPPHLQ